MNTTNVTMAAKQAVKEQAKPFKVTMEVPNTETIQAMNDAVEGKSLSREYSTFSDMMKDIDTED